MGIKTYKAYTPSRRNMTGSDFSEVTKKSPEKSLLAKKSKTAGRNNQGKITVRHHGGGNRQKISRETRRTASLLPLSVSSMIRTVPQILPFFLMRTEASRTSWHRMVSQTG